MASLKSSYLMLPVKWLKYKSQVTACLAKATVLSKVWLVVFAHTTKINTNSNALDLVSINIFSYETSEPLFEGIVVPENMIEKIYS